MTVVLMVAGDWHLCITAAAEFRNAISNDIATDGLGVRSL